MREINLLDTYPVAQRRVEKGWRTDANKLIAKRYDKEFFDGDRVNGYGGYYYDGRWRSIVNKMRELYSINSQSAVLDIGCAKGFLLYDLQEMIPGINVSGIDISRYAIAKAMDGYSGYLQKQGKNKPDADLLEQRARESMLPKIIIGSAENLPWSDNTFDVVLSINTTHNLPEVKFREALREMNRVCKPGGHKFIQVDAYRTQEEFARMQHWVLTAETMLHVDKWVNLFSEESYDGDYYWTTI